MSTDTTDLEAIREAFALATAGNWRDYPEYVDRILDQALAHA